MSHPFVPIKPAEIVWQEGTPYSKQFGDIYFAKEGGIKEKQHVLND